jgi:hypothetical protein
MSTGRAGPLFELGPARSAILTPSPCPPCQDVDRSLELLTTVAPSIQAISLIQLASDVESRARDAYSVFSAPFVNALARCLKLRHFESVGRFFFRVEDWKYLCTRAFAFLDQVHVES